MIDSMERAGGQSALPKVHVCYISSFRYEQGGGGGKIGGRSPQPGSLWVRVRLSLTAVAGEQTEVI